MGELGRCDHLAPHFLSEPTEVSRTAREQLVPFLGIPRVGCAAWEHGGAMQGELEDTDTSGEERAGQALHVSERVALRGEREALEGA